jgi:MFS superfamily sulfate permease-like transporter
MKILNIPADGMEGLKQNWKSDAISGFLIFLIAMPLCIAISKASGFPPIAGIYTAIIGGIIVSFFMGSRITIKGPAAGLIAIAVGSVEELGRGDNMKGYQLTLAVIVIAAIIQIAFGLLKAGKLGDFFPASAVHGMLAAIGIIIISKQIPVLLGTKATGREPFELLAEVPALLKNMNPEVALIGSVSLLILFFMPLIKSRLSRIIPPSMIVLLLAIPLAVFFDFSHEHDYSLAHINYHIIPGNLLVQLPDTFLAGITFPDFSEVFSLVSLKYILMFALIGSLESILSAKAIDILDPFKRKSDLNKDLLAVGTGNLVAGAIGGLPMISEIVRSSANINNGAKTRWSNFFHGVFLLVFVALAGGIIEMIPNAALAAMLIYTGYRLASPREFHKTWIIGWDQLIIFVVTIVITLATDLLVGIFAGVVTQFLLHLYNGASVRSLFTSNFAITNGSEEYVVQVKGAAIFSNYLSFKKCFDQISPGKRVIFNFAEAKLIDHTLLEHLHHFEEDYHNTGGNVIIQGMGRHSAHSGHPLATRKISKGNESKMEIKLTSRQTKLRDFAEENEFTFYPMVTKSMKKFKDFPIQSGTQIQYEENIISRYTDNAKVEISDINLSESARSAEEDRKITVIHVTDLDIKFPDFALEPEGLFTKFSEISFGKDIDFTDHPEFSKKYYLRGNREDAVRTFFSPRIIRFLEEHEEMHIESHRNKLLIYRQRELLTTDELGSVLNFVDAFIEVLIQEAPVLHEKITQRA